MNTPSRSTMLAVAALAVASTATQGCLHVPDKENGKGNVEGDVCPGEDAAGEKDVTGEGVSPDIYGETGEEGTRPDTTGDINQPDNVNFPDGIMDGTHGNTFQCMNEELVTSVVQGEMLSPVFGGTEDQIRDGSMVDSVTGQAKPLSEMANGVSVTFDAGDAGKRFYEGFIAAPGTVVNVEHPMTNGQEAGAGVRVVKIELKDGQDDIVNIINALNALSMTESGVLSDNSETIMVNLGNLGFDKGRIEIEKHPALFNQPNATIQFQVDNNGRKWIIIIEKMWGCDFGTQQAMNNFNDLTLAQRQDLFNTVFTVRGEEEKTA